MDFGSRLKEWCRKGFPELGDFGGMGIGATTHKVLSHEKFDTDPHFVRTILLSASLFINLSCVSCVLVV